MTPIQVGPHKFKKLGRFHRKKCQACYLPEASHPTRGYTDARPYGDKGQYAKRAATL